MASEAKILLTPTRRPLSLSLFLISFLLYGSPPTTKATLLYLISFFPIFISPLSLGSRLRRCRGVCGCGASLLLNDTGAAMPTIAREAAGEGAWLAQPSTLGHGITGLARPLVWGAGACRLRCGTELVAPTWGVQSGATSPAMAGHGRQVSLERSVNFVARYL
jgi:hypothetical protein